MINFRIIINNRSFLSIIDQGLVSGTNFIMAFVLGRMLSEEMFGMYILSFSIWLFVNNLQIGFINQGLYVLRHKNKIYEANVHFIQLLFSITIYFLLVVLSFLYYLFFRNIEIKYLIILSLSIGLKTLKEFVRNNAISKLEMLKVTLYDFLFFMIIMLVIGLSYLNNVLSYKTPWIAFGVSALFIVLIDIHIAKYSINFDLKLLHEAFMDNLKFSKWTTLTNILIWGNGNIYKFIISIFVGVETIAAVGAAQYITFLLNPFLIAMQNFGMGKLSKAKTKNSIEFSKSFKKFSFVMFFVVLAFLLPIFIFPDFFVNLFYGDKFSNISFILRIFCFGLLVSIFNRLINMKMLLNEISKSVFVVYMKSILISTILLFILLHFFKIQGFYFYLFIQNVILLLFTVFEYQKKKEIVL